MDFSSIPNLKKSINTDIQNIEYPNDYSYEVTWSSTDLYNLKIVMKFNVEFYKKTLYISFMSPLEIVNYD